MRKNPGKIVCLRASEKLIGVLKGDFFRLGSPKPLSTLGHAEIQK
jgi:hypothetical protein